MEGFNKDNQVRNEYGKGCLNCRRFPIMCENDLYKVSCKHCSNPPPPPSYAAIPIRRRGNNFRSLSVDPSSTLNSSNLRSSENSHSSHNNHNNILPSLISNSNTNKINTNSDHNFTTLPTKFTSSFHNSGTRAIIKPIACRPILTPSFNSLKNSQHLQVSMDEISKSENNNHFGKIHSSSNIFNSLNPVGHRHDQKANNGFRLSSQKLGGSLNNVLPFKDSLKLNERFINDENGRNNSHQHNQRPSLIISGDDQKGKRPESTTQLDMGIRKLKNIYAANLQAVHQKLLKMENTLIEQSCQLEEDRKRLQIDLEESSKKNVENETLKLKHRKESETLKSQLEEMEWTLCHRTGEIALLKAQIKDCQGDQATRTNELIQLRSQNQELATQVSLLRSKVGETNSTFRNLEEENISLKQQQMERDRESMRIREENDNMRKKLKEFEFRYSLEALLFDSERSKWKEEQMQVLRYQKALQQNYLETRLRAKTLEEKMGINGNERPIN